MRNLTVSCLVLLGAVSTMPTKGSSETSSATLDLKVGPHTDDKPAHEIAALLKEAGCVGRVVKGQKIFTITVEHREYSASFKRPAQAAHEALRLCRSLQGR